MEWLSLLVSVAGVGLSIVALVKAKDAEQAVENAISISNEQRDRDSVLALLRTLTEARKSASGRRAGATPLARAGRHQASDLHALELAADELKTASYGDTALNDKLQVGADELDRALRAITADGGRDGWEDARLVLQALIPELEKFERRLGVNMLRVRTKTG